MPTAYKVERAPDRRAGCKDTRCKAAKVKFEKGEIRFGTWVSIPAAPGSSDTHQSWAFKHWGCVTPKQIENLNKFMEGNFDLLEGYDELDSEWQQKVRDALEQGHVDDEDWKWEAEPNRPGARRTPKKKAKPKQDEADEDAPSSPAPKAKKRGRKADDEGEAVNPPAKKKATKSKSTATDDEGEAVQAPAKKKPTKSKAKVKDEGDVEEEIEAPAKKKATKTKTKTKTKIMDESEVDAEVTAPKKARATKAKAETATGETSSKRSRKKKDDSAVEADEPPAKAPSKRGGRKKNAA